MNSTDSNAAHGRDFQSYIDEELRRLKRDGYLTQVIKEFRAREPGYQNPDQYYAPFLIQFNDRTRWVLFSTTSMRTDRIKGQQWDADRLKQVDATISKALLVYPDDVKGSVRSEFIRQKQKYDTGWEFSRIDDIIAIGDLLKQIKDFDNALQSASLGCEPEILAKTESQTGALSNLLENNVSATNETDLGRAWDIGGRNFERFVAGILSDAKLLSVWKECKSDSDFTYDCFCKILCCLKVNRENVLSIRATADKDDIGLLPSGGSPKTDVIAIVKNVSGQERQFTFSCKRSAKSHVSAHQYSADAFANVLDKTNDRLRALLRTFQIYGNKSDFPKEDAVALESMLLDKISPLCKWVVGGHGGEGREKQLADYVVTFRVDTNQFAIHSTNEYVRLMIASSKGYFGTPFQWTFASGQRGKSIQLKMPML